MKNKIALLVIVIVLIFTVLPARDFKEYAIGTGAKTYPELELNQIHDNVKIYTSPDDSTQFCGIYARELKVTADSTGNIVSKLITLRDYDEIAALDALIICCEGLREMFGSPKAMIVDGNPVDDKKSFDTELAEFFKDGESFDIIYPGKSASNIVSLKRIQIDDDIKYDVTVFIAND